MFQVIQEYFASHLTALRSGDLILLGILLAKDVLIVFSVAAVAIIIERILSLKKTARLEESGYCELRAAMKKRQVNAVRACARADEAPSAAALSAGLEHGSSDEGIMREAIAQEVVVQTSLLQRNLSFLGTVASTAPYVGLFGTVLGILFAFNTIAVTGHAGASVVAGGISEALITTAMGLGVAIPAVIAYNYFNGVVNRLSLIIETHALDLASRLPDLKIADPEGSFGGGENDATG
ncbi:MAG: MotA/TolQ/ExbB proton channel family protein [Abditibacteriaceae bacterium]